MNPKLAKEYLEKVRRDYQVITEEFDVTRVRPWPEMSDLAVRYVKEGDWVLDVACGNGRLFKALGTRPVNYLGLDSSASLIDSARRKFPGTVFLVADMTDLSGLESKKFDVIFLIAALHHVPSRQFQLKVLSQIYDHLKSGGCLIMENWNLRQPKFWRYWLTKYWHDPRLPVKDLVIPWRTIPDQPVWRFCHAFSLKELADLIKASGLILEEQYYVKKGVKSNWLNGHNIVSVARK